MWNTFIRTSFVISAHHDYVILLMYMYSLIQLPYLRIEPSWTRNNAKALTGLIKVCRNGQGRWLACVSRWQCEHGTNLHAHAVIQSQRLLTSMSCNPWLMCKHIKAPWVNQGFTWLWLSSTHGRAVGQIVSSWPIYRSNSAPSCGCLNRELHWSLLTDSWRPFKPYLKRKFPFLKWSNAANVAWHFTWREMGIFYFVLADLLRILLD